MNNQRKLTQPEFDEFCERHTADRTYSAFYAGTVPALRNVDLSGLIMSDRNMPEIRIEHSSFRGCDLTNAVLIGACLRHCDFTQATMTGCDMSSAAINGCTFEKTDLGETIFSGSSLERVLLPGARLTDYTILPAGETWQVYQEEILPELLKLMGLTPGKPPKKMSKRDLTAVRDKLWMASRTHPMAKPRLRELLTFLDSGLIARPAKIH